MRANVESGIAKIDVCVNVNFVAGTKFTYAYRHERCMALCKARGVKQKEPRGRPRGS